MIPPEEDDALWRLLGRAKETQPSAFFARNVTREVRALSQEKPTPFRWLLERWPWAASATCAVVLLANFAFQQTPPDSDQLAVIAQEVAESRDYLVITDLDELLASEESSVWLDKPVY